MIDLHTHTLLSDGGLLPAELVRRAETIGYRAMVISDHVDSSVIETVVGRVVEAAKDLSRLTGVLVVPGAEITHCPVAQIHEMVKKARELGARIVTVHGETLAEPVAPGTNYAAIEAGTDLLAHPGLITEEDVKLAVRRGVCLEVSGRKGHCLANGHVVQMALKHGARLYFGSDAHQPEDLVGRERAIRILCGAGLTEGQAVDILAGAETLLRRAVS